MFVIDIENPWPNEKKSRNTPSLPPLSHSLSARRLRCALLSLSSSLIQSVADRGERGSEGTERRRIRRAFAPWIHLEAEKCPKFEEEEVEEPSEFRSEVSCFISVLHCSKNFQTCFALRREFGCSGDVSDYCVGVPKPRVNRCSKKNEVNNAPKEEDEGDQIHVANERRNRQRCCLRQILLSRKVSRRQTKYRHGNDWKETKFKYS